MSASTGVGDGWRLLLAQSAYPNEEVIHVLSLSKVLTPGSWICVCLGMLVSLPARADAVFTDLVAQVQIAGTNFPGEMVSKEGRFATMPVDASLSASWVSLGGTKATAAGSTVADYGTLRGLATAVAGPGDGCRFCFTGNASTLASWLDYFTFTAPPGTNSVTVRFTLDLDGKLSAQCASILSVCTANASLSLDSGDEAFIPLGAFVSAGTGQVTPPPPATAQEIVSFSNGQQAFFHSELDLGAGVGPVAGSDATTADFSSTGRLFVDVLTPGASYTTASGRVYSSTIISAVPEPRSIGLVAIGIALMIARSVYGKRRSHSA